MTHWPADDVWSGDDDDGFDPPAELRTDRLDPDQKRRVWTYIKQHEPNLRTFLEDPEVQGLVNRLNAIAPGSCSPVLPWHVVEASLTYEECQDLARRPEPARTGLPETMPGTLPTVNTRPSANTLRQARDQYLRTLKRA